MIEKWKKITKSILFLLLVLAVVYGIMMATLPKIPDFYKKDKWDVVFFGTSQSYCSFNPAVFDEYGLDTYNRGRQQQTMNYTYYYIKDALEVSEIDIVVLEVFGMMYDEGDDRFENETIRESTLGDFRYSKTKIEAVKDCVVPDQQLQYLFPLDKYHTNWEKWNFSSLETIQKTVFSPYYKEDSERGYMGWIPSTWYYYPPLEEINSGYRESVYSENIRYLEMIQKLCEENGAELLLVKAPLPCHNSVIGKTNTISDWAAENNVPMINMMQLTEEIGLNQDTDSLDEGVHLNQSGASKVSKYLAEFIVENYY